jgi:hypothetical protein
VNLEPLATWLGPRYVYMQGYDAGRIYDGETAYPLDDDQLLGAILRRAAELGMQPSIWQDRDGAWWAYLLLMRTGPTPLSAALAAVEELCKETT